MKIQIDHVLKKARTTTTTTAITTTKTLMHHCKVHHCSEPINPRRRKE
jgi:hypothetical protein